MMSTQRRGLGQKNYRGVPLLPLILGTATLAVGALVAGIAVVMWFQRDLDRRRRQDALQREALVRQASKNSAMIMLETAPDGIATIKQCVHLFDLYLESVQMVTKIASLKGQPMPGVPNGAWYATYSKQTNSFRYSGDIYDNSLVLNYFIAVGRHREAWELAHTFLNIMMFIEKYDPSACDYEKRIANYRGLKPRYNAMPDGTMSPGSDAWMGADLGNNSYMCISLYKFGFAYDKMLNDVYNRNLFLIASYDLTRWFMEAFACNPKKTIMREGQPDGSFKETVINNPDNSKSVAYIGRPYVDNYMTYISLEHMIDMYALANIQAHNYKASFYAKVGNLKYQAFYFTLDWVDDAVLADLQNLDAAWAQYVVYAKDLNRDKGGNHVEGMIWTVEPMITEDVKSRSGATHVQIAFAEKGPAYWAGQLQDDANGGWSTPDVAPPAETEFASQLTGFERCTNRADQTGNAKVAFEECRFVAERYVKNQFGRDHYDIGSGLCYRADTFRGDGKPTPEVFKDEFLISHYHHQGREDPGDNPPPVDTQTWNMLADCEDGEDVAWKKKKSLDWAIQYCFVRDTLDGVRGCYEEGADRSAPAHRPDIATVNCDDVLPTNRLYGFRFTTYGHGIQWENAGSGVMALMKAEMKHEFNEYHHYIELIIESIRKHYHKRSTSGSNPLGLFASYRTMSEYEDYGNQYGSFANTGLTWGYYRDAHLGGSTYPALSLMYYEHYMKWREDKPNRAKHYAAAEVYNPYSKELLKWPTVRLRDLYPTEKAPDEGGLLGLFKHPIVDGDRKKCKIGNRMLYTVHDVWRDEENGMIMPTLMTTYDEWNPNDPPVISHCQQWSVFKKGPDLKDCTFNVVVHWTAESDDYQAEVAYFAKDTNYWGLILEKQEDDDPKNKVTNLNGTKFQYGFTYDENGWPVGPNPIKPGTHTFKVKVSGFHTGGANIIPGLNDDGTYTAPHQADDLMTHTVTITENGIYELHLNMTFTKVRDGGAYDPDKLNAYRIITRNRVLSADECKGIRDEYRILDGQSSVCFSPTMPTYKWRAKGPMGEDCIDENVGCPGFHNKIYWMCGYPDSWFATFMKDKERTYMRFSFSRTLDPAPQRNREDVDALSETSIIALRDVVAQRLEDGFVSEKAADGEYKRPEGFETLDDIKKAIAIGVHESDDVAEDLAAEVRAKIGAPPLLPPPPRDKFVVTIAVTSNNDPSILPAKRQPVYLAFLKYVYGLTAEELPSAFSAEYIEWLGSGDTRVLTKSGYWRTFFERQFDANVPLGYGDGIVGKSCGIPFLGNCNPEVSQALLARIQNEYLGACIGEQAPSG